jgi:hypothetical protein
MSDSLEGMPEFDKPQEIVPLVVPDVDKPRCTANNKAGNPCSVHPLKGEKYCLGHAKSFIPELRDRFTKQATAVINAKVSIPGINVPRGRTQKVKSREEILAMLSKRLDLVDERFGAICNPEVEQMICDICRTIAVVMKIEVSEDVKVHGWRMKGTG